LKRYTFTAEEKKIIQATIVTAKKENPNMKLIGEAGSSTIGFTFCRVLW